MKPKELVRLKLEDELSELWNKPLFIVASPSGYGKTTLVQSFLSKSEDALVVWLPFGKEVVDEAWVWTKLCDKFHDANMEFAEKLRKLGLPRHTQEIDYVIDLVGKYINKPVCLVLDDYQECVSEVLNRLLTRVVYENIPNFHILMITRIYPDIPYAEMLLQGYCGTIDQTMLSLNREETDEIFRINGLELSERELDQIYEYTDGWISAVYLALFDYRRNGPGRFFSAPHLLKTSVFEKLDIRLQDLYKKMSLFESFTQEEAVYIAESEIHPMALTEAMEQYGFMQYDPSSKRFSMHSLLRTVAAGELAHSAIDQKRLYNRGGEWCEKNGDYIQAVVYYEKAGNVDAVMHLYSGEKRNQILEEAPGIAEEIFRNMPVEVKAKYPTAWLSYIYSAIMKENPDHAQELYKEARAAYVKLYRLDQEDTDQKELRGEMLIIRALMEFNNLERTNACLSEAYELLDHHASRIFRQTLLTYGAPFMTLLYYNQAGGLKRTIELEKEYSHYHMLLVGGGDGGWDDLFDAEYAMLTGDMEKACLLARQVAEKAILRKQLCIIISSYYLQFRCLVYLGREAEFTAKMKEFMKYTKELSRPILVMDTQLAYSYVYACLNRKELVADWICNFNLEDCNRMIRSTRSGCITYGMILCKTGQWSLLDTVADQTMVPYERSQHIYAVIRGYIYKAIASYHLSGMEKAGGYLQKALELAEKDEVRISFIENSPELQPIFEKMEWKGKFAGSLKPYFRQYQKSLALFGKGEEKNNLTKREKELMNLVRAGCRNSEISEKMNIALVTVEKNLTSVYRKLGVSNRAAAIAKLSGMPD